jgi:hypothetical protein
MATTPLSADEHHVIDSLKEVFGNALGTLDGPDPPEGGEHLDKFFLVQDQFTQPNGEFPALLNNVLNVFRLARDSVKTCPGKLGAWQEAVYPVLQPYIKDGPENCQAYTKEGKDCGVRLTGERHQLAGVCSRHFNQCLLTAVCMGGMYCATKAPCMYCGEGAAGGDTMHCIGCSRLVHVLCLSSWIQDVCPSKASLFDVDRDAVVCANCLWRRWPAVVLMWHLERVDDPSVQLLALPVGAYEVEKTSAPRAGTFEVLASQVRAGRVFPGLMAILPDPREAGVGTPARGVRRGAASAREGAAGGQLGREARRNLFPPSDDDGDDDVDGDYDEPLGAGAAGGGLRLQRALELGGLPEVRGVRPRAGVPGRGTRQGQMGLLAGSLPAQRDFDAAVEAAAEKAVARLVGGNIAHFHQPDEGALRGARDGASILSGEFIGVKDGEVGSASCPQLPRGGRPTTATARPKARLASRWCSR